MIGPIVSTQQPFDLACTINHITLDARHDIFFKAADDTIDTQMTRSTHEGVYVADTPSGWQPYLGHNAYTQEFLIFFFFGPYSLPTSMGAFNSHIPNLD